MILNIPKPSKTPNSEILIPTENKPASLWDQEEPTAPKLTSGSLPSKIYYSLEEAATIAKCEPKDLLHYGNLNKIRLIIAVPDGIDLQPHDLKTELTGTSMFCPEIVTLQASYCRQIEFKGRTEQSDFSEGFIFEALSNPRLLFPHAYNSKFTGFSSVWRTFHQGELQKIELAIKHLFVMAYDLDFFLKGIYMLENKNPIYTMYEYKSEQLRRLNHVSNIKWGNILIDPDDSSTHPTSAEIIHALMSKDLLGAAFSQTLAEKGASIIRPHFAAIGRPSNETKKPTTKLKSSLNKIK